MQAVKSQNTAPELIVRSVVHRMGYRFRLHRKDLPGKPDLTFPVKQKVIFVHGCFWHGHHCARGARTPKANREYWVKKIARNKMRDQKNLARLTGTGWSSLSIWECELRDKRVLKAQIRKFLK